ncbi:hypothetical protein BX600DRAFT_456226 [Xylariales sp. PMI_506]|nr:hypothetical protein BX600DRAFT_456226 [Xylariales sp. PMI_506]
MGLPQGTQLKLAQAAVDALGVKRYFPWQWGIDYDAVGTGSAQDLFDEQLQVRQLLRSQGETDWIIVSTGLFTSFLFLAAFGAVDLPARKLRGLGSWDTPVTVTAPVDIGRMAAELVYDPRGVSHQVVYVAGDTVTYGRVADLVEERFLGVEFTRDVWDLQLLANKLREQPDDGMVKYQNVFAAGKGVAWDMANTVNMQRGITLQDVQSYLTHLEL